MADKVLTNKFATRITEIKLYIDRKLNKEQFGKLRIQIFALKGMCEKDLHRYKKFNEYETNLLDSLQKHEQDLKEVKQKLEAYLVNRPSNASEAEDLEAQRKIIESSYNLKLEQTELNFEESNMNYGAAIDLPQPDCCDAQQVLAKQELVEAEKIYDELMVEQAKKDELQTTYLNVSGTYYDYLIEVTKISEELRKPPA